MIQEKARISEKAGDYFESGFHCAEAVAAAVLEGMGEDASTALVHATAFGGGFGRTYEEACGAISGSLIAIGHLCGRKDPGAEWDTPASLAAKIRQKFIDQFETTHCAALRKRFGEEKQMKECCHLVRTVAFDLVALLSQAPLSQKESGCGLKQAR